MPATDKTNTFKPLTCGNPECGDEFLAELQLTIEPMPTGNHHASTSFPISCPTCERNSDHPGTPGVTTRFIRHFRPK
jgi:hypothetical protein